jgi:glycosyltransferase involved in cell wall biosynthesis
MSNDELLFTAIVTAYNLEHCLERCLEKILLQTYSNFELIIINDGSTDSSLEIINKLKDSRVIVIDKVNTGVSDCRNLGIEKAVGKYICFIDGDDFLELNYLENVARELEVDADLLIFNYVVDTTDGSDNMKHTEEVILPNFRLTDLESILPNLGYVWNKIYKLEILKEKNIRFRSDIALYEDIIFNTEYFSVASSIRNCRYSYYHYFNRPIVSLVKTYNQNGLRCITEMNHSLNNFLYEVNLQTEFREKILAENLMLGVKHQINALFKFQRVKVINTFDELMTIVSNNLVLERVSQFRPKNKSDRIYK